MAEKNQRSNTKTVTTLKAYAQLELDNSPTCIPRLCKFNIVRIVLTRSIDGGDANAIVVAVKIQNNKRTFRCCEIPLQQDGTLDVPVNLQYMITYPHYFKRDLNIIQIYIQRRKNRPMIGYKILAKGQINLNHVIQHPQNLDLHLYLNTNEKSKLSIRPDECSTIDAQKHSIGYVSVISLTSTIPNEAEIDLTANPLSIKQHPFSIDKSFNDDDEYIEEEELNSELEDSDVELNIKTKQKFNRNLLRNKLIQMFKRKSRDNPTKMSHSTHPNRQSDIEEEDPPSDISDSTIPVDQWSIESVPKPGFTPMEHLQILNFTEDEHDSNKKSINPFDGNDSPLDSDTSDLGVEIDRTKIPERSVQSPVNKIRESAVKQLDELYTNDRLPESIVFLYTGLNQSNVTSSKFKEYNLSVISLHSLNESKAVLTNLIQRIQRSTSQSVIRIVLLGHDAFVNSFLQSYVECLASRPHEYMAYFRFYFVPLVFSYLAKFLGSLDGQYEVLFGNHESPNEISELVQRISKYLKTSQRTLSLPIGEVMLNRKGQLPEEDSSPTFLPFFCYVRLGTLSSNESQFSSIDDNALLSASFSFSLTTNHQARECKDSSDDENSQALLITNSPQTRINPKSSQGEESSILLGDVSVDYWTTIDQKKDGLRTIKSSLKSNIRVLTITRQPTMNADGKISTALTLTFVTGEKKQKMIKFGKKLKDLPNNKLLEPQAITGINRLVCTSKSQNVDLKVNVDGQEWDNVKFFQISSQWHTHIKYFPLALFNEIRNTSFLLLMKESLFLVFLFLFHGISGQQKELIAGHVLFRHGDRTPITTYPTDTMKENDWPNGFGQLTTTGVEQHHRLGQFLRTRYESIVNATFHPNEIYVRSTDYDRTLMSAQSNLIGFYPVSNVSNDTVPIQPIPIHTIPIADDFLLGVNECPRYEQIETDVYQTDEFKAKNEYYRPFFDKLQGWTNLSNITLYNAWDIADTIFVEHIYNKTPAWANEEVRRNLSAVNDLSFYFLYANDDTKRIRGGPVIEDIWKNMNNSIHGQSAKKLRMYSAHDTTVSAALAFLGINYPHQPVYASALFIDLYKQNSIYYVKVEYINVTDSNKPYSYLLNGCPAVDCPLDIFTSIYKPRFPANASVECSKTFPPTPPADGGNTKLTVILILLGVMLGVIVLAMSGWLYSRRAEHDSPLLSAEAYTQVA